MNAVDCSGVKASPLVTVVATCYNHAPFLSECLDSILAQTYKNLDIIITDDHSTDNSVQLIDAWIEKNRVKCTFLKHDKNLGLCRTLNQVLACSRGQYISGLATDDVWFPDKIEKQVSILEKQPERVGVLYTDALVIEGNGSVLETSFIRHHGLRQRPPTGDVFRALWQGNFIPAMTTMVRRSCYERVGGYDEDLYFEDWDMWLRIARQYEFWYEDTVSARYRVLASSMCRANPEKMLSAGIQICRKHIAKGLVTKEVMSQVADKLYFFAKQCYVQGHPDGTEALSLALEYDKTARTRLLWLFSRLRICPQWYDTLVRIAKRTCGILV